MENKAVWVITYIRYVDSIYHDVRVFDSAEKARKQFTEDVADIRQTMEECWSEDACDDGYDGIEEVFRAYDHDREIMLSMDEVVLNGGL